MQSKSEHWDVHEGDVLEILQHMLKTNMKQSGEQHKLFVHRHSRKGLEDNGGIFEDLLKYWSL